MRYSDGTAVKLLAGQEDPEDSAQKGINYRTEPIWFRMGHAPEMPLTFTRTKDFFNVLKNAKVGGDPQTPVSTAKVGTAVRFRILQPGGHPRNHVWNLHGHIWERSLTAPSQVSEARPSARTHSRNGKGRKRATGRLITLMSFPSTGRARAFKITGDYLVARFPVLPIRRRPLGNLPRKPVVRSKVAQVRLRHLRIGSKMMNHFGKDNLRCGAVCLLALALWLSYGKADAQDKEKRLNKTESAGKTTQRIMREGLAIELSVEPVVAKKKDSAELMEEEDAVVRLKITDGATNLPIPGLRPSAWIDARKSLTTEKECKDKIRAFVGGDLSARTGD